jgi:hypothetical protein
VPENSPAFYTAIKDWISNEANYQHVNFSLSFHFELLSSSSLKPIHGIIQFISSNQNFINSNILWKYDKGDEDMKSTGILLNQKSKITFQFIEVDE